MKNHKSTYLSKFIRFIDLKIIINTKCSIVVQCILYWILFKCMEDIEKNFNCLQIWIELLNETSVFD